MTRLLLDGSYRVVAPRFVCTVCISNGRVEANLTAPILRRLGGMTEASFFYYSRQHGWRIEEVKRVGASLCH